MSEKKIVSFETVLQPVGRFEMLPTPDRTDSEREPPPLVGGGTRGGIMMARILGMSLEDRVEVCRQAVGDPMVVWFAMLSPAERLEFIRSAEHDIRERLG